MERSITLESRHLFTPELVNGRRKAEVSKIVPQLATGRASDYTKISTVLVGQQEGHLACKNSVVRYWCVYLSGARCK